MEYNSTDLIMAVKEGDIGKVRIIIESGVDIHDINEAALQWAAYYNYVDIARMLLEAGADPQVNNSLPIKIAEGYGRWEVHKLMMDWIYQEISLPPNNDGRDICCKCHSPTKRVNTGFSFMDVCSKCGY